MAVTPAQCSSKNPNAIWNISTLVNNSTFLNAATELPQFLCLYYSVSDILDLLTIATGIAKIVGCALGVVSSIAAIFVFTRPQFRTTSYFYHCVINISDLLNSIMFLDDGMTFLLDTSTRNPYKVWFFARYYFLSPTNELSLYWGNLLTIWVAVERCVATLLPRLFSRISNKKVVALAMAGTFLINFTMYLPKEIRNGWRYDNATREYVLAPNEFGKSERYKAYSEVLSSYMSVVACLMSAATFGVVVGLAKVTLRKRRLIAPSGSVASNKDLLKRCAANAQLCILQLCQGIPLIAHEILHVAYDRILPFSGGLESIRLLAVTKSYQEATTDVSAYLLSQYIWFAVRVSTVFSHCCHFYLYMIFGSKVRNFVLGMMRNEPGQVTQTFGGSRRD